MYIKSFNQVRDPTTKRNLIKTDPTPKRNLIMERQIPPQRKLWVGDETIVQARIKVDLDPRSTFEVMTSK